MCMILMTLACFACSGYLGLQRPAVGQATLLQRQMATAQPNQALSTNVKKTSAHNMTTMMHHTLKH